MYFSFPKTLRDTRDIRVIPIKKLTAKYKTKIRFAHMLFALKVIIKLLFSNRKRTFSMYEYFVSNISI